VKLKKNYQVGEVIGFKGKRAIVKVGQLPMNIDIEDLLVVEKIEELEVSKIGMGRNKTVGNKSTENKSTENKSTENKIPEKRNQQSNNNQKK
jgi:hypothetical protein